MRNITVLLLAILWIGALPSLADETYDTNDLRPLRAYRGSAVHSVHPHDGRTVGFSERSRKENRETTATVWNAAGRPRRLPWDGPFQLDGYQTEALDINARGDVVGVGRRPDQSEVLLFWPYDGEHAHWLEIEGHIRRAGLGADGLIFVELEPKQTARIEARVVRFDRRFGDSGETLPGLFPGASTMVFDLGPDGTAAGASTTSDGRTVPVLWKPSRPDGGYVSAVLPAAADVGFARGLAPAGSDELELVVGVLVDESGSKAVTWLHGIAAPLGAPEGFDEVEAVGVDREGYVLAVVVQRDEAGSVIEDALWWKRPSDGDAFFVAGPRDGRVVSAALSENGCIALSLYGEDGRNRAFLLTPPRLDIDETERLAGEEPEGAE